MRSWLVVPLLMSMTLGWVQETTEPAGLEPIPDGPPALDRDSNVPAPEITMCFALTVPPNALFTPETIDPEIFQLEETTRSDDNYLGDERIFAAYGQVELAALEDLSVLFGARVEASRQAIELESAVGQARSTAAELHVLEEAPGRRDRGQCR